MTNCSYIYYGIYIFSSYCCCTKFLCGKAKVNILEASPWVAPEFAKVPKCIYIDHQFKGDYSEKTTTQPRTVKKKRRRRSLKKKKKNSGEASQGDRNVFRFYLFLPLSIILFVPRDCFSLVVGRGGEGEVEKGNSAK